MLYILQSRALPEPRMMEARLRSYRVDNLHPPFTKTILTGTPSTQMQFTCGTNSLPRFVLVLAWPSKGNCAYFFTDTVIGPIYCFFNPHSFTVLLYCISHHLATPHFLFLWGWPRISLVLLPVLCSFCKIIIEKKDPLSTCQLAYTKPMEYKWTFYTTMLFS